MPTLSVKTKTKIPSKLCCTKCNTCKGISKNRWERLVGQFGTAEELLAKYVCRSCRKEHGVRKDGKMLPKKNERKERIDAIPNWMRNWPPIDKGSLPKLSMEELKIASKSSNICWRPDIWSYNNKACNGCKYYPCGCAEMRITKEKNKDDVIIKTLSSRELAQISEKTVGSTTTTITAPIQPAVPSSEKRKRGRPRKIKT